MRQTRVTLLVLCMAVAVCLSGCKVRLADMSVLSTRNVSLDKVRNVAGIDSKWMILFFPIGIPHLENAVDDALNKGDGDLMIDAVLSAGGWWFLVGKNTIIAEGTVVKTRGGAKR